MKPSNIFLDAEKNVKLGDFGLATKNRDIKELEDDDGTTSEASSNIYDAIDDIRPLLGTPAIATSVSFVDTTTSAGESMTGGVGTTFYRAPEQEGKTTTSVRKGDGSYTVQADIFSFGVILFEMFHPPFSTYMERAEILTTLQGNKPTASNKSGKHHEGEQHDVVPDDFKQKSAERFPKSFVASVPENAQR